METLCLYENFGTETLASGTETLASGTETLAVETLAFETKTLAFETLAWPEWKLLLERNPQPLKHWNGTPAV